MKRRNLILCLSVLWLFTACRPTTNEEVKMVVDSLNERAYHLRYVDVDSLCGLSERALLLATEGRYEDGRAEALNSLAFYAYQQMNFNGVDSLLDEVRSLSSSPLQMLCADVMQMKTCQRTGQGARFFQSKSRAEGVMADLQNRTSTFSDHQLALWVYAQSEFHIITSTYYFYQEQDSLARAELAEVLPSMKMRVDTAQWVYYNYMLGPGRLVEGENAQEILLQEFDYLFKAYRISRRDGYRYFEANALQGFATMLLGNDSLFLLHRSDPYNLLRIQHEDQLREGATLSEALARHAISLFAEYGDLFQTACAHRTLGEVFFAQERYEESLEQYELALSCVNRHHLKYYAQLSPDTLMLFNPDDLVRSVEKEWIEDERIYTVPDWILGIRQQLSLTFSALDQKQASDYNRNFYLDLLQATNQNLELENRMDNLKRENRELRLRMWLCIVLLLAAVLMALFFRRSLKLRVRLFLTELKQHRWAPYEAFRQWSSEEQQRLQDDCEEMQENLQVVNQCILADKRKNIENRAKVSLVHGIVPFLDRVAKEVSQMMRSQRVEEERKTYIVELIDEIERHNVVLTEWIKIEQGQLSLHISTVSLQKLFQIVQEGHFPFDQKHIELRVKPTQAEVKADESLTLFMINTLADNARKFTPEGGRVSIEAVEADDYVEIRVEDTGCGLKEDEVEMLMHNKVLDTSQIGDRKEGKGFGFGLMNCRGIIEKYKKTSNIFSLCTFGVQSRLGEGSTFYFRLPKVVRIILAGLLFMFPASAFASPVDVYEANLDGRYSDAIREAGFTIDEWNSQHPDLPPILLFGDVASTRDYAEVEWLQRGIEMDYAVLVELRNEVAIAALALHDWPLYHYNNRACIRLHRLLNQDKSLPTYFHKLERTHQQSNALLVGIVLFAVVILFLSYRLLVSNQVEQKRQIELLKEYLSQLFDMARLSTSEADFVARTSDYPALEHWARDYQQRTLTEDLRPILDSRESLAVLTDEKARQEYEHNRLYVQNQVLENCLSTIKHESMFYPSRIRILAERLEGVEDIRSLSELVQYYRHIYTLLCSQADAQIGEPGFKRQQLRVSEVMDEALRLCRRSLARLSQQSQEDEVSLSHENGLPKVSLGAVEQTDACVVADSAILAVLFESLLAGMMHDRLDLVISCTEDERFVRFSLCDRNGSLTPEQMDNLFFPASGHIPFLLAKQILREHDTYAHHPGCRLAAQVCEQGGYEIYFTLLRQQTATGRTSVEKE